MKFLVFAVLLVALCPGCSQPPRYHFLTASGPMGTHLYRCDTQTGNVSVMASSA